MMLPVADRCAIFLPNGGSGVSSGVPTVKSWQLFQTPRGFSELTIFGVSGGGGGGAGQSGASLTNRGGGGGGGCSSICVVKLQIALLPDTLYVMPGRGGVGGISGGASAGSGEVSYVCVSSRAGAGGLAAGDMIWRSSNSGPTGGNAGVGGSGGAAGGTGSITTVSGTFMANGLFAAYTGLNGGAGGSSGAAGTSNIIQPPINPGAGGGGVNTTNVERSGGDQFVTAFLLNPMSIVGGATGGGNGSNGVGSLQPFWGFGGSGGGSSGTGVGGNGGDGWYGCGGGGGGAGVTGGNGGRGGDGICIITWA